VDGLVVQPIVSARTGTLSEWTKSLRAGRAANGEPPWFALGDDDVFTAMGCPLDARQDAALHLNRVFTPEVCRKIAADPERGNRPVIAHSSSRARSP
jgi:hypothetical protein